MSATERQLNTAQQAKLESRREQLLTALESSYKPALIIRALVSAEMSASDLAVATGAHQRTAAAWIEDPEIPPRKIEHRQRLDELKEVLQFMIANGTIAYQEVDWLRYRNRLAGFKSPLELIRHGDWKRVVRIYCDDVAAPVPKEFLPETLDENDPKPDGSVRLV